MSIDWRLKNCTAKQVQAFLAEEYVKDTGIPVHLYSVVNATFSTYNRSLAITDNKEGALFFEGPRLMKSYGGGNPLGLLKTLGRCGVKVS